MTEKSLVLTFDTASDALALAVGKLQNTDDGRQILVPLASGDLIARREANIRLVPAIKELFIQNNLSQEQLACVVCGRGPGSFTGVRIAVATAKGIAAGIPVPLYGVATPDALAWQAWIEGVRGPVAVLLDAMRGEVYPARYELDEWGAFRRDPLTVVKSAVLAQRWQEEYLQDAPVLMGDALYKYGELFSSFARLEESLWRPRGTGLLKAFEMTNMAWEQHTDCDYGKHTASLSYPVSSANIQNSIASLLPLYTRLSDAEENERKRLATGGAVAQGALIEVAASGVAWPLNTGQPVYRPAAQGDIAHMATLEKSAYGQASSVLSGECWTEAMYADDLGLLGHSWWVCYLDNTLAGFIGGMIIDAQMHILDVVVREEHRRRGIAEQLIQHLGQEAQDLGINELTLEVRASNKPAQALYKKLGFREVGRRTGYYSPLKSSASREDALIMTGSAVTGMKGIVEGDGSLAHAGLAPAGPDHHPLILALESSCDETAGALIDGTGLLLSNVVASQTDFHARFGGVVPEIASRKHTEAIYPTALEALGERTWQDLDALAVTYAPGLIGALVVGLAFAKGLSWSADIPLIKVDHLEGHLYANQFKQEDDSFVVDKNRVRPPFVSALISGGNTMLVHVRDWGSYEVIGETLDDAVGEAYDKVAKALGLGYPGGPVIAKLAEEGNPEAISFPRALLYSGDYQFSLSGLKTAVLTAIREHTAAGTLNLADIAASFEQAVIEVQVAKALKACKNLGVTTFCIGGGVAANKALREAYSAAMEPCGIKVVFPLELACTDNAAMIAAVALDRYSQGRFADLSDDASAQSSLEQLY